MRVSQPFPPLREVKGLTRDLPRAKQRGLLAEAPVECKILTPEVRFASGISINFGATTAAELPVYQRITGGTICRVRALSWCPAHLGTHALLGNCPHRGLLHWHRTWHTVLHPRLRHTLLGHTHTPDHHAARHRSHTLSLIHI